MPTAHEESPSHPAAVARWSASPALACRRRRGDRGRLWRDWTIDARAAPPPSEEEPANRHRFAPKQRGQISQALPLAGGLGGRRVGWTTATAPLPRFRLTVPSRCTTRPPRFGAGQTVAVLPESEFVLLCNPDSEIVSRRVNAGAALLRARPCVAAVQASCQPGFRPPERSRVSRWDRSTSSAGPWAPSLLGPPRVASRTRRPRPSGITPTGPFRTGRVDCWRHASLLHVRLEAAAVSKVVLPYARPRPLLPPASRRVTLLAVLLGVGHADSGLRPTPT